METIRIERLNQIVLDIVLNKYLDATIINPKRVVFLCLSSLAAQLKNELIKVFGEDYVSGDEFIEVTLPPQFEIIENKTSITFYEEVYQLEVECQ